MIPSALMKEYNKNYNKHIHNLIPYKKDGRYVVCVNSIGCRYVTNNTYNIIIKGVVL